MPRPGNKGCGDPDSSLRCTISPVGLGVAADPDSGAGTGRRLLAAVGARVLVGARATLSATRHAGPFRFPRPAGFARHVSLPSYRLEFDELPGSEQAASAVPTDHGTFRVTL